MSENDGLIAAYLLNGQGGGRSLDWDGVGSWKSADGLLWVHLDMNVERAVQWLRENCADDPVVCDALLAENTRPRLIEMEQAAAVFLRGVNLNPGADPEDMVGVRVLVEKSRIVTIRLRRIMAVEDIREAIEKGIGPRTANGFVVTLANRLVARMEPVLGDLEDQVSAMEDEVFENARAEDIDISMARTKIIILRRYLKPQKDTLLSMRGAAKMALSGKHRGMVAEAADRVTRYLENLDAFHERLSVINDELRFRQNERMSRAMYLLSVVAAVLMPPSLIAGLLGVNVGGIPGAQAAWAFPALVGGVMAICVLEILLLRRLKWI